MTPDVQAVLARAADYLRQMRLQGSDQLELEYATATGIVAGIHQVKLISNDEHAEWLRRMEEAANREWATEDDDEPETPLNRLRAAPAPRLIRFIVGSGEPKPLLDGEAVVPLLEVCDDRLLVWWRIAPLPSPLAVFGDELRMLQRDVDGLGEGIRDETLWIGHSYSMRLHYVTRVTVSDELGTRYRPTGGGATGSLRDGEITGHTRLTPSPPAAVHKLTIRLGSTEFPFRLQAPVE